MTLLDTNVISESLRPLPSAMVEAWVARQNPTSLYISAITMAEILAGIAFLPDGQPKSGLRHAFETIIESQFKSRVLPFDEAAAPHYSGILAAMPANGRAISTIDCQIGGDRRRSRYGHRDP